MKTTDVVFDDTKMTDEQLGGLTRRSDELKRRINEGTLGYEWVMDELQRVVEGRTDQFAPPPGGRVYVLTVSVMLNKPWNGAVLAAGPDTPDECDVWKVGDLYPATNTGTAQTRLVLVNFGPNGGSLEKAVAWAKQYGLKRSNPRQVFAIGEHKPQLHHELGMNPMYAVATEECFFEGDRQVCHVWWRDAERRANLHWTGHVGDARAWFVFA